MKTIAYTNDSQTSALSSTTVKTNIFPF